MAVTHDFRCRKCQTTWEVTFESFAEFKRELACSCGGEAVQTWTKAPGFAGLNDPGDRSVKRSFDPGAYDVQAGRVFLDRAERDRYLKTRGLVALGPDEYRHTVNAAPDQEPKFDREAFRAAANEAYEENAAGKITQHNVMDARIPVTTVE